VVEHEDEQEVEEEKAVREPVARKVIEVVRVR
jgi:hypothetical protein